MAKLQSYHTLQIRIFQVQTMFFYVFSVSFESFITVLSDRLEFIADIGECQLCKSRVSGAGRLFDFQK